MHRHGRTGVRFLLPVVVLLAVALVGCSGASAGDASPVPTTSVDLPRSYRFAPEAIVVSAGATVTWTNSDAFTHSVRLADGDPLFMSTGESVTHTFSTPGLYRYDCSLHATDMQGSVLVTGN